MMLGEEGNMKDVDDVDRLVSMMQTSKKIGQRCTYLNIIKSTIDPDILNKFIESGGWTVLNDWLQEARAGDNNPLLEEILEVYQGLPITVELLKQNASAKTIKQLIRANNDTVKNLANGIVNNWMKTIKGGSSEKSKSKKKKHHHHHRHQPQQPQEDTQNNGTEAMETEADPPKYTVEKPDVADSGSNDSVPTDTTNTEPSNMEPPQTTSQTQKPRKAKTVKTIASKFRSTGLEVESAIVAPKKKATTSSPKDKLSIKRLSIKPIIEQPPEKRPRLDETVSSTSLSPPTEPHLSPRLSLNVIPHKKSTCPVPASVAELYDSSGFMDALTNSAAPHFLRKKRRTSNSNQNASDKSPQQKSGAPTSPDDKKPLVPSFYKETLQTSEDTKDAEATTEVASASPTHQDGDNDNDAENGARMEGESEKTEESETGSTVSSVETIVIKKAKRVSWAEETSLKTYHYFMLDETERVNVNKVKDSFSEIKRQETMLERKAIQSSRHHGSDRMDSAGYRLIPTDNLPMPVAMPGCNSQEKHLQKEREQSVLLALYFSRDMIPDCPKEPDPEKYEPSEPRVIPADDVTGESGEVVFREYPEPVEQTAKSSPSPSPSPCSSPTDQFSLSEDVAQILANLTNQGSDADNLHSTPPPGYQHGPPPHGNNNSNPLPPEMMQMLNSMSNYRNSHDGMNSDHLPPHIQEYLHGLQQDGQYSDKVIDQFRHMLTMMPQGSSYPPPHQSQNGPGSMPMVRAPGQGLLGNAPPGQMPQGPMPHNNMPPNNMPPNNMPPNNMPPPGMFNRPPMGHMNGPPPHMMGGPPSRFPREGGRPDDWNENMRGGPNMRGGGSRGPPPGIPQGDRWRGPRPMNGPPPRGPPPRHGPPRMRGPRGPPGRGPPAGVCKYFLDGRCRNGDSCSFIHPGVNGPPL